MDAEGVKVIVGIGNPGPEYDKTRHNVGFEIVDEVARERGLRFRGEVGPVLVARDERGVLIKPQGYVNRSGEALLGYFAGALPDPGGVLIVLDDLALPLGAVRLRAAGSHGGHNGLRSLLAAFGTESVPRLRVGIGSVGAEAWREHVLSRFSADEEVVLRAAMDAAVQGARGFLEGRELARLQQETHRASPSAES